MKINDRMTDYAVLDELGHRIKERRLNLKISREKLASNAGVGRSTVERMEGGKSVELVKLIRILRAMKMLEILDAAVPKIGTSPMELLKLQGTPVGREKKTHKKASKWIWGDEK